MRRPSVKRFRRPVYFLAVALSAIAVGGAADAFGFLSSQEQSTVDVRFGIRGPLGPPSDVRVVTIDDITFDDLARVGPSRAGCTRRWSTSCTARARR